MIDDEAINRVRTKRSYLGELEYPPGSVAETLAAEVETLQAKLDAVLNRARIDLKFDSEVATQYAFGRRHEAESILIAAAAAEKKRGKHELAHRSRMARWCGARVAELEAKLVAARAEDERWRAALKEVERSGDLCSN